MGVVAVGAPARTVRVTERDVYERAADLLGEFEWTQGHDARDGQGEQTLPESSAAVAMCLWGAIRRACFDLYTDDPVERWHELLDRRVALNIRSPEWNDGLGRTKTEVVQHLRYLATKEQTQ